MSYGAIYGAIDERTCQRVLAAVGTKPMTVAQIAGLSGVSMTCAAVALMALAGTGRVVAGCQHRKTGLRYVYSRAVRIQEVK